MERLLTLTATLAAMMISAAALASDAETSASVGSDRLRGSGTAAASARYVGRAGFAQSEARSGPVSMARGIAVGVDKHGVSLSVSNAVAPRHGPAVATTFNLSIDRSGRISKSTGLSVSRGPLRRSAVAGGNAATSRHGTGTSAFAAGKTDRFGRVHATVRSHQSRLRRVVVIRRPVLPEVRRFRSCRR